MPKKTFTIPRDSLYDLYVVKNKRRYEIANIYGCSDVLIKKTLAKFGIKKGKVLESENKKRREFLTCAHCGSEFEVTRFRATNEKWKLKFCSTKCSGDSRYLGERHKRAMLNAVAARRRARLKNQTPVLSEEDNQKITDMYLNCEPGYEVDHIIPLARGGLHHPDNLQYLTMTENRQKWCK